MATAAPTVAVVITALQYTAKERRLNGLRELTAAAEQQPVVGVLEWPAGSSGWQMPFSYCGSNSTAACKS